MIYIILGAALFIAAAYATGEIVFLRRRVANLKRDHQDDLKTIYKMSLRYDSMKEARDHYKDEYHALVKANLKDVVTEHKNNHH